jgi:hypothetical protein
VSVDSFVNEAARQLDREILGNVEEGTVGAIALRVTRALQAEEQQGFRSDGDVVAWANRKLVNDLASAVLSRGGEVERLRRELRQANEETTRLKELLNTPELHDFAKAVALEAAHQRERWQPEHDAEKTDADWFWLIGYLAGKALHNPGDVPAKRLHRIITIAAAAANWHAARMPAEDQP